MLRLRIADFGLRIGARRFAHKIRNPQSAIRNLLLCFLVSCSKPEPAGYQSVSNQVIVVIPRGATYYQALDSLEAHGVIKNRDWFSLYARIRGLPSSLKSGVYTFAKDESWSSVVTTLKKGRGMEARFTVLEAHHASKSVNAPIPGLAFPKT